MAFPDAVTKIDTGVFQESAVAGMSFGPGSKLESIGKGAFCNCMQLARIALPAYTKTIASGAFSGFPVGQVELVTVS